MKDFKPVRHIRTVESGSIIHASVEQKLTSHVSDLVVFDKHYFNIPHVLKFDGVLLFADVSGFTALTEKYTMSSEKGTDALTVTLNDYIGKIVQNILQAGGDVLKFAGDAILAVWKVKERQDIAHAVSQAAKCSLAIQDKCDNQSTDVGVKLRVKIAISAGKIYATFVGNNESCHFVMAGRPVREVNAAEKYCQAGLVVLSPNATELSDKEALILEPISERFALVKYLRREPRKEWRDYIDFPSGLKFTKNAEYSMRVALGIRPDDEREKVVRKYVTPVVQRKLDDHQPLKFLSEMRQCSILFVNLTFDLNERDKRFHEKQSINMQSAFTIVYNNTKDMQGSLNKIFMFDKGCTFLIIFGLPGDKHEQEPAHALQASWKIYQELHKELSTLTLASFGVTTGPVFCGVIGHEERHEYTVIGQKVNLAARFMMHYPNIVSCDFETYNSSKLSKDMFTRLPHQAMKGVGNVIVYGYKEGERQPVGTTTVYQPEYPLIGREEELQLFLDDLRSLKSSQAFGHERRVIVYEGEAGCGKTRLMKEIQWRAACEGVRVASFTFSINDFNSPFFAVKSLLELLLSIEKCKDHKIKEQALLTALDSEETEDLCLLNEIMTVKFPMSFKVKQMEPDEQTRALHEILVRIVHKVTSHQIVLFALDDAQNIDNDSWALLTTLSKDYRALLVLTMRPFSPEKPPCDSAKQVVYHPKTVFVMLRGLMREHLTPLACQLLHVERIPLVLEKLLIERSHNVPLWCEQFIREMQSAGILLIVPLSDRSLKYVGGGRKSGSDLFRKSPAVGVVDRSFITRRKTSVGYETNQDQVAKLHKNNDQENTEIDKDARKTIQVSDNDTIKENPTTELSSKGAVLTSWTNRIKWHTDKHQDVGSFLKQVPATDKESLQLRKSATEDNEIPMECIVKPNFDLRKFPVPASIRGMALARLDRMKPFEQLVVKCAAVIGENMSRKMLQTVVPGFQEEKFEAAIYELMLSRVFECASVVSMEEKRELHGKQSTKKIGDHSFCVTCHCAKNIVRQTKEYSSSVNEKDIASGCEQFRFHNSLVQETAYKLWLEDQCRSLHETCAGFLEAKINEVLITGVTDDIITTQFRLSSFAERHMSLLSNSTGFQKSYTVLRNEESVPSIQDGPQNESATSVGVEKNKSTSNELTTSSFNQQRLSYSSVIGRMTQKSVGSRKSVNQPLQFKDELMPLDTKWNSQSDNNFAQALTVPAIVISDFETNRDDSALSLPNQQITLPTIFAAEQRSNSDARRMTLESLWTLEIGVSGAYGKVLFNNEELAKKLSDLTSGNLFKTPFETHDILALLYTQLVHHWRRAAKTEKTIEFLLKASESLISISNLGAALRHLQQASEIVDNLDKGLDIVSNFTEDDDLNLDDVKVLSVGRNVKAKIQSLLGQVLFQQGQLEQSLTHFLKALKLLRCKLPQNSFLITLRTWIECRRQKFHLKNPSRYIGSARSRQANLYVEQVRCLSYVWQILHNLKCMPNRMKLSKLVAMIQVNRAEAADDDLRELITAYTCMMQIHQLAGDIYKSALYENRAIARCLELPKKLTSTDLYITGHLHLVSCSVRLCQGKLSHATTAGYRAYKVADTLGDVDIKLIVLPLLVQIHLLTGRGRACIEVLSFLLYVSKHNADEPGISAYYSSCLDLILDAGYALEGSQSCVEYMQSTETIDIGDISRFYVRTSMAVWCYRRNEADKGRAWLKLSTEVKPSHFDNFLAVRAFTRLLEARLLALKKSHEAYGLSNKETLLASTLCKDAVNQLQKLCKKFPVFTPRSLLLTGFYQILLGNSQKAQELITRAINLARYCGNLVDYQWAFHNKALWVSPSSKVDSDYWIHNCESMPNWELPNNNDHVERCFSLKPVAFTP